jgi:hypothetical protein
MDKRSKKVFQHNIKDFSNREQYWMKIYVAELEAQGKKVRVFDYGVDNSGKLITGTLKNHNADNILIIDNKEYKIEIKTIPETSPYFTFKTFLLTQYLKQEAYILVPRKTLYYLISPQAIKQMLLDLESKIHYGFSPNDPSVRCYPKQMNEYVNNGDIVKKEWGDKAKKLINKHAGILFKKKKI